MDFVELIKKLADGGAASNFLLGALVVIGIIYWAINTLMKLTDNGKKLGFLKRDCVTKDEAKIVVSGEIKELGLKLQEINDRLENLEKIELKITQVERRLASAIEQLESQGSDAEEKILNTLHSIEPMKREFEIFTNDAKLASKDIMNLIHNIEVEFAVMRGSTIFANNRTNLKT